MANNAPEMLREWLLTEGRKGQWLAAQVEVDRATLSLWINGHQFPRRHHRKRLADITGLPVAHEEAWL